MNIPQLAKDSALVTIGFGVLAWQKAQVRRREVEAQLKTQTEEARAQLKELATDVDRRVQPLVDQFEARLDEIEQKLPEQARDAFAQARGAAKEARTQLRARLGLAA